MELPVHIFFDVDGVVIRGWHSKPERRRPWDVSIAADLGIDRDAFRTALFGGVAGTDDSPMRDCVRGDRDLREVLGSILPSVGYRGAVDAFIRYWFIKDASIDHDVLRVVKSLEQTDRVQLYLLTAQEHLRAEYLWTELRLRDYFRDIVYTAKLRHLKDAPGFFDKVRASLGINVDERPVLFDDDSAVVEAALAAGWDAYAFDTVDDLFACPRVLALLSSRSSA